MEKDFAKARRDLTQNLFGFVVDAVRDFKQIEAQTYTIDPDGKTPHPTTPGARKGSEQGIRASFVCHEKPHSLAVSICPAETWLPSVTFESGFTATPLKVDCASFDEAELEKASQRVRDAVTGTLKGIREGWMVG